MERQLMPLRAEQDMVLRASSSVRLTVTLPGLVIRQKINTLTGTGSMHRINGESGKNLVLSFGLRYDYISPPDFAKINSGLDVLTGVFHVTGPRPTALSKRGRTEQLLLRTKERLAAALWLRLSAAEQDRGTRCVCNHR